jgi:hypothetical protein
LSHSEVSREETFATLTRARGVIVPDPAGQVERFKTFDASLVGVDHLPLR